MKNWVDVYGATLGRWMMLDGDYGTLKLDDDAWEELRAILRRDWAVRVLDAWASQTVGLRYETKSDVVALQTPDGPDIYTGDTPDAARHAAALAVFPTLPDAVRELGECP